MKHLRLNIDNTAISKDMVDSFIASNNIDAFMGIQPHENAAINCYAIKKGGEKFEFKKGNKSLAKKLGCDSSALTMVRVSKNDVMPDKFIERMMMDSDMIKYQMSDTYHGYRMFD